MLTKIPVGSSSAPFPLPALYPALPLSRDSNGISHAYFWVLCFIPLGPIIAPTSLGSPSLHAFQFNFAGRVPCPARTMFTWVSKVGVEKLTRYQERTPSYNQALTRAPDPPGPPLLLLPRAASYFIVNLYTNGQPSGMSPVRLGLMLFALCSIPCPVPRPSSQSWTYSSIDSTLCWVPTTCQR